ncbi:ATPase YjoB [Paenibacillus vulneris]|uniref:ATP-binding protein n=1 Tax=Paenibacillus vulneris TaxID=1133364 RepID=A0ABW3UHV6_9BACL
MINPGNKSSRPEGAALYSERLREAGRRTHVNESHGCYIIPIRASEPQEIPQYFDTAVVIERIQQELESRYGAAFQMYVQDDYGNEIWDMLDEDVRQGSGQVEHAAVIYDRVESKAFSYQGELGDNAGYRIFPASRNNLFVYPSYGVALVRIPVFRPNGSFSEEYVFAVNDDCLGRFLGYMRERQRENDRKHVTVFTDSRNGLDQHREPITRSVSRDEVIMSESLKQDIYRSIDQFFAQDRQFFQTYRIPYKRGILLYGRPGNGKTTLVKSIAGSVNAPVTYWQITEHTCSYTIQEAFESAVKMAPMVLVIEDIDSMPEQARSFFLNTLDGATSKEGIFLIGTTNYPERIDPALMNRAGRFDRAYEIKLPDEPLRRRYLAQKQLSALIGEDEAEKAVRLTDGFTFAQLNELYVSAALEKHYEPEVKIEELIRGMRAELNKEKTQHWHTTQPESRMGFVAG